jgi:hypothetical protein
MGAPNYFEFTHDHSTPYVSLSHLYLRPDNDFITDGWGTGFWYEAYGGCGDTRWYPERDPVTLTIVSGSEFGKFVVGDDPALVTTVTLLVSELPTVRFIPSGRYAPDGEVTIEARCLSLVSGCMLRVKYCTILLGETKYFYAVQESGCETYPRLTIYEADSPVLPPGAEATDVWVVPDQGNGTSPVRNSGYEENSGSRLGVYWEKNKPIPGGAGDLPVGMIRLVGRYWHPDSVYTVELRATKKAVCWGREGIFGDWVPIEVKKPARLGDTYGRARDVFDREINIDDSCITYGAKFGIPPHFLKAQISKESPPGTFTFDDGKTESGFAPGYRFEPYTTQFSQKIKKLIEKENPFVVLPNSLREPPPPDHHHVRYMDYIKGAPVKVWHFVENYSQLVDPSRSGIFGVRMPDGRMDFGTLGYKTLQTEFNLMFDYFRDPRGGSLGLRAILSVQEAADSARERMIDFLKNRWRDGLNNIVAQSRIAASYGLFQTLYATGLQRGYPADIEHLPEGLNIPETNFPLSVRYQDSLLRSDKSLGNQFESEGNWPMGLEESFKRYVYRIWNDKSDYGDEVIKRFSLFLPKN